MVTYLGGSMQLKFEKQKMKLTDTSDKVSVIVCPFWVRDKLRDNGLIGSDWFNKDVDSLFSMEEVYAAEVLYYIFMDLLYFYCMNKNKFINSRGSVDAMHHDPLLNLSRNLEYLIKPVTFCSKYIDSYDEYIHCSLFALDREPIVPPTKLDMKSSEGILLSEIISTLFLKFNNPIDEQNKKESNFNSLFDNITESSSMFSPTYRESTETQKTFSIEQLNEHTSVIYIEKNFFMPIIDKFKTLVDNTAQISMLGIKEDISGLLTPILAQQFDRLILPYGLTPNSHIGITKIPNEYYSFICNYFTYINYSILHEVYKYESLPVVARTNEFANLVGSL